MKHPLQINVFTSSEDHRLCIWSKGHHSREDFFAAIELDEEAKEELLYYCGKTPQWFMEENWWPSASFWRCVRDFETGQPYYTVSAPRRGAFPVTEIEVKYATLGA